MTSSPRIKPRHAKSTGGYYRIGEAGTPSDFEIKEYYKNLSLPSNPFWVKEHDRILDKVNKYEAMYM